MVKFIFGSFIDFVSSNSYTDFGLKTVPAIVAKAEQSVADFTPNS